MIIYTTDEDATDRCYPNLRAAEKAAREYADYTGYDVEISREEVVWPITKKILLEILNTAGGSWSLSSEVVKTIHPQTKQGGDE